MNFEEMKNVLEKYNQNHVVLAYERANEENKKKICADKDSPNKKRSL